METALIAKRKYRKQPSAVAYSMSMPFGIELDIKASANAWWMDREILEKLIEAFKIDAGISEACLHAGITLRQYKYFLSQHPQFDEARRGYALGPAMMAKMTIMKGIKEGNYKICMWYLERKCPEEFGRPSRRKNAKLRKWERARERLKLQEANGAYDAEFRVAYLKLTSEFEGRMKILVKECAERRTQAA